MPSFLYLADHVLPNPTPTFSSCVISRDSSARVTRLLTVSRRAVSYFWFSVPLDVLLPLPRWPFSPPENILADSAQSSPPPQGPLPLPSSLAHFGTHTLLYHSITIYTFLHLSLQNSKSYLYLPHSLPHP